MKELIIVIITSLLIATDAQDTIRIGADGRVEVFEDLQWGTVCSDNVGETEGIVICRILGQPFGRIIPNSQMPSSSQIQFLRQLQCAGNEQNIRSCDGMWGFSNSCDGRDLGIVCGSEPTTASATTECKVQRFPTAGVKIISQGAQFICANVKKEAAPDCANQTACEFTQDLGLTNKTDELEIPLSSKFTANLTIRAIGCFDDRTTNIQVCKIVINPSVAKLMTLSKNPLFIGLLVSGIIFYICCCCCSLFYVKKSKEKSQVRDGS